MQKKSIADVAVRIRLMKENDPEQELWRAVVCQAIEDIHLTSKKRNKILAKERALKWLKEGGDDFMQVCEYAELNAELIKDWLD